MERNKLETQMREKLNSREIQPSARAWDRLDAMLSVAEEKKTKRPFGFLFIAASILVLLTVGMFLFTQKGTTIKPQNNVVETETKKDTIQNPIVEQKLNNEAVATSEVQQSPINNQRVSIITQERSIQKTTVNQKLNVNQNQIIKDKVIEFQNSTDVVQKDLPRIEKGTAIIFESNKGIKSDEVLVADLDKTSKQITSQNSTVKVDAKSLLSQVDGEVEYTFREKVLNKMNKNYKEIKVALTNRNNQ